MAEAEWVYPDEQEVRPLASPVTATVTVPGSKSITNRALVLAALSADGCELTDALFSEDTAVMCDALGRLGWRVEAEEQDRRVFVVNNERSKRRPDDPRVPADRADLFVANSGTSMRFLTALVSLGHGRFRLDGVPRMRERPIADLMDTLGQLGVSIRSEFGNGCPPVIVDARGLRGGTARVRGDVSSQFLSALLLVAPFAEGDVDLVVEGPLVSEPYVEMTVGMLHDWRLRVDRPAPGRFVVPGRQKPNYPRRYAIEPDASAASYFWAAAAVTGGAVTVPGLSFASRQGDVAFALVLEQMGCSVLATDHEITVRGGPLRGIDVDMNGISDTVMTIGAVALFADGPTTVRNVAHVRHKETDRIAALATEMRKFGAAVEERADGLTITPGPLRGAVIDTYNDHRMAMSLALVGLRVSGVVIRNPGCVAKTYPGFWEDFTALK